MIKRQKIVIVSYAAHPMLSPRSHRTTELAKGFAKKGHDVTLYILTGGHDYSSFEKETGVKVKSLGNTKLFKFDFEKGSHYGFIGRIINKLIGKYIEYPGIELSYRVNKVLKQENNIDLLISIAVPYTLHWGVAWFKQKYPEKLTNTVWVADCGDPFMGNPFVKHPFYFEYIEKWFSRKTDFITIPIEEGKDAYYPEFRNKIRIIPQGFDFDAINIDGNYKGNIIPTFIFAGRFYENSRDPRPLLDYLVKKSINFRFIIYTKASYQDFITEYKPILKDKVEVRDYVPREQLIREMSKADFLLNLENPSSIQLPSKLIDYALSKRPILSVNTNIALDAKLINDFLNGDYSQTLNIDNIEQYNIKNIVQQFENLSKEV